jgi:hypothetical protein
MNSKSPKAKFFNGFWGEQSPLSAHTLEQIEPLVNALIKESEGYAYRKYSSAAPVVSRLQLYAGIYIGYWDNDDRRARPKKIMDEIEGHLKALQNGRLNEEASEELVSISGDYLDQFNSDVPNTVRSFYDQLLHSPNPSNVQIGIATLNNIHDKLRRGGARIREPQRMYAWNITKLYYDMTGKAPGRSNDGSKDESWPSKISKIIFSDPAFPSGAPPPSMTIWIGAAKALKENNIST